jgi:hypothetical protein
MPFKSRAQQRWMFANDPAMAKKWAEETPDMSKLPDKRKKKNESRVSIPKSIFQRIVMEEVVRAIRESSLGEAEEDEAEDPSQDKKSPKLASADKEKGAVGSADQAKPKSLPKAGGKQPASQQPPGKKGAAPEVPDEPDPADDDIEPDDKPAEDGGGELNDELSGKTIQSLSLEPKSKLVAGAAEIVLTFNETTDPLRVIVTKTGAVKFFYRGSLHNMP